MLNCNSARWRIVFTRWPAQPKNQVQFLGEPPKSQKKNIQIKTMFINYALIEF